MAKIIFGSNLKELALSLQETGTVFVPTKKNPKSAFSEYAFAELTKETVLAFDYPYSLNAPKEYLFPAKDALYFFENGKRKSPERSHSVVFGISLKDLEGIEKLKIVFQKPILDNQFWEKAEKNIVVAIDHFSPPKDLNFDLYLQKVNEDVYAGFAKTKTGQKILGGAFFKNKNIRVPKVLRKKDPLLGNKNLSKILNWAKNHPLWEELSKECLGCGICTYVCPLCYCFDVKDEIQIEKEELRGARHRLWDSCLLKSFKEKNAGISGEPLGKRIYNWYFHKFSRMPKEYGFTGCIDCNRCVIFCPAKINYRKNLKRLVSDWEKENENI